MDGGAITDGKQSYCLEFLRPPEVAFNACRREAKERTHHPHHMGLCDFYDGLALRLRKGWLDSSETVTCRRACRWLLFSTCFGTPSSSTKK